MRVENHELSQLEEILGFTLKKIGVFWLSSHFNKIHDCIGKASSTATKKDCMTFNSHLRFIWP